MSHMRRIQQVDNDPKHTSKDVEKWFTDNKVNKVKVLESGPQTVHLPIGQQP